MSLKLELVIHDGHIPSSLLNTVRRRVIREIVTNSYAYEGRRDNLLIFKEGI